MSPSRRFARAYCCTRPVYPLTPAHSLALPNAVRRSIGTSPDGGLLWSTSTYLVAPGEVFGGYTSMQVNTPIIGADGAPYGCIVYERNVSSVAVISFSLFPLDF